MKKTFAVSAIAMAWMVGTTLAAEYKTDDEGFIRNWLVLAPIPIESGSGADEIAKEQIKNEGKLTPKEGDKATVGDVKLEWKTGQAEDYYLDFNVWLKKPDGEKEENVVGYLTCTVVAPEEMKNLQARLGSNDQGRLYLNGKDLFTFAETRTIDKDSNTVENVTLLKGENTVVFKIINAGNNWQGCLRFTDKNGAPIKNLKVVVTTK